MAELETIRLPYHKTHLKLSNEKIKAVLTNRLGELPVPAGRDVESALVRSALDKPVSSPPLKELARDRHKICIITSDYTRPVPSKIGILPSGGHCIISRQAAEADLLIAEGFIEPHFFAGYSGGRKAVLPGVASRTTVLANHCSGFIAHPKARTGNIARTLELKIRRLSLYPTVREWLSNDG